MNNEKMQLIKKIVKYGYRYETNKSQSYLDKLNQYIDTYDNYVLSGGDTKDFLYPGNINESVKSSMFEIFDKKIKSDEQKENQKTFTIFTIFKNKDYEKIELLNIISASTYQFAKQIISGKFNFNSLKKFATDNINSFVNQITGEDSKGKYTKDNLLYYILYFGLKFVTNISYNMKTKSPDNMYDPYITIYLSFPQNKKNDEKITHLNKKLGEFKPIFQKKLDKIKPT